MSRFHKKISIGHFSLTLGSGEIVFVYIGKRRVYIKTLYLRRYRSIQWPAFAISFLIIGFACYHVVPMMKLTEATADAGRGNASDNPGDNPLADEEKKNSLLKSAATDFSVPKENRPLVIYQHKVKKGENLSEIAKKYGISMDTICGSNRLFSYDIISEGSVFMIPNKDGILHKVEKGNRIATLAEKYKVSAQNIINQNSLKNPDFLPVGQTIFIPDAKPQNLFPGYLWPVSSMYITCGFGWRVNPFNGNQREFHQGMDIKSAWEHVRASKYGKITYAGWLGGYGNAIIVAHPNGVKSLYAHLSSIYVKTGQYVKQGQFIGRSGNTGRSTGAHLHFEIIQNGVHKNPYVFIKNAR